MTEVRCEECNKVVYKLTPPTEKIVSGKTRFHGVVDIPAVIEPIAEVRRVIHEDLKKYEGYNMTFTSTDPWRFIDAIQRHLNRIYDSGDPFSVDDETGCAHVDHVGCNYMFLEIQKRNMQ